MKKIFYIIISMLVLCIGIASADVTCSESINTAAPSTVDVGETFSFQLQAYNVDAPWGATVEVTTLGGCTINGQTSLRIVMLSDLPNPLTYSAQAQSTAGTCTINYDYKFGDCATSGVNSRFITVEDTPGCTCTAWVDGACEGDERRRTRTCTPGGCNTESQLIADVGCETCAYSSWTTCSSGCTQTRTVTSGTGCTGPLSQSCTGGNCVSGCTYSDWSTCSSSCTQTRTVTSGTGCTGPLSQSCTGGNCQGPAPFDFCESFPYICDNKEMIMLIGGGILLFSFLK